ncbi:MAG: tRNA lysidine(34) synthetase TilS, partial [Thermoanaerobaculia bacterium]
MRREHAEPLRLVVAFSGGPDSLALLWGLTRLRALRVRPLAAHLDHALDPGSADRAELAAHLARRLDVPLRCERWPVPELRRSGEALEAAARRVRYAFLIEVATAAGADAILTGHHRDDQAETVLLRIAHGSGWAGLAAVGARPGRVLRPLLAIPKRTLLEALSRAGLTGASDPGNDDPRLLRNRLRRSILPRLAGGAPGELSA